MAKVDVPPTAMYPLFWICVFGICFIQIGFGLPFEHMLFWWIKILLLNASKSIYFYLTPDHSKILEKLFFKFYWLRESQRRKSPNDNLSKCKFTICFVKSVFKFQCLVKFIIIFNYLNLKFSFATLNSGQLLDLCKEKLQKSFLFEQLIFHF